MTGNGQSHLFFDFSAGIPVKVGFSRSLSGVDLNDEASNLMVYQKAYTAACRLMTTLSDALDSLLAM